MAAVEEVIADVESGDTPEGTLDDKAATTESAPAVETDAGEEPVTDDVETPPAADAGKRPEPSVDELKATVRAVTREREALKKRLAEAEVRYEAPASQRQPTGDMMDAGGLDPLLKGKAYDPTDKTVEYAPGEWYTVSQAKALAKADYVYDQTQQAGHAQEAAKLAEDRNEIYTSVGNSVTETVKKAFPNLSDQARGFLKNIVDESFVEAMRENRIPMDFDPADLPDDFPDIVKAAQLRGLDRATTALLEFQNPQKAKQVLAAATQPVAPGGTPAAPGPKKREDLTPEEAYTEDLSVIGRVLKKAGLKA